MQLKQNTPEWLEMRRTKIGASDLPIIMGVSPYKTAHELYLEKTGLKEQPELSSSMKYGHDREEDIRQKVSDKLGVPLVDEVVFHTQVGWAMASIDGSYQGVICEIKCANAEDHGLAKKGKVPEKYYPQLQWQMFCTGAKINYYCSYHKRDLQIVQVKEDKNFIIECYEKAERFLYCLINKKFPQLKENDLEYRDDPNTLGLVKEYRAAYEEKIRLKKLMEEAETVLKDCSDSLWRYVGKPCQGRDFRILERSRKGVVDYKKLCEEQGISEEVIELYRKESIFIKEISLS